MRTPRLKWTHTPFLLLLAAALLASSATPARRIVAATTSPLTQAQQRPPAPQSVIYAVEKYADDSTVIDPIAFVRAGRFTQTPGGNANDGTPQGQRAEEQFIKEFYRPGREYRVTFGGGEAGTARVVEFAEQGCVGMVAKATLQTTARLGGQVEALATDSATFGRGAGTRRAPTAEERAAAIALARKILGQKRVPASAVARMEVYNLTAVDTDGDGRQELIGSFLVMSAYGAQYALFLVATRGAAAKVALTPSLAWFKHGRETDAEYRQLVDVLDVDGDGVAEIFIRSIYYESHDYSVYKRARGAWRVVFTGGGGGC